ncbi:MAG: mechanosensitive ion channel family protein [Vampirovibrionales bacterium]|nr:mechanosensitive ion channel family protein [Vampirovibrionales bacterium]
MEFYDINWIEFFNQKILGNSVKLWCYSALTFLSVYYGIMITVHIIWKKLKESRFRESKSFVKIMSTLADSTTRFLGLSFGIYFATLFLKIPPDKAAFIKPLPIFLFLIQIGYWGNSLIQYKLENIVEKKKNIEERHQIKTLIGPLRFILLVVLWSILTLVALDNFGVNVTALVTGLGIGGVAVALAVQNTLSDLFAALSIAFDKPFIVGDFIITDDYMGNVEKIGLKTTRIRSLSGEEVIIPNHDLLNSRIRNYKRMQERRVVFSFGVIYQTSLAQLKTISGTVKGIIESIEQTRFDRANFFKFGDSSYDFEVVYYVLDSDYNLYMNIQEEINFGMIAAFEEAGIEFAYPTRTLYIHQPEESQGNQRKDKPQETSKETPHDAEFQSILLPSQAE